MFKKQIISVDGWRLCAREFAIAELLRPSETLKIRSRFRFLGHVGMTGVYDPDLMSGQNQQLPFFSRYRPAVLGETRANISNFRPTPDQPHLVAFLESIRVQASKLGDVWLPGCSYFIQHIHMLPGTEGDRHQDRRGFDEAVAITTTQGTSRLLVEEHEYPINPGDVVFLDPNRRLWHQGIAGSGQERVGLVIAR